jgi:hypothetical protein
VLVEFNKICLIPCLNVEEEIVSMVISILPNLYRITFYHKLTLISILFSHIVVLQEASLLNQHLKLNESWLQN